MSKILVMAFLCLSMNAYSQTTKPLSIGDTVPDITLNHIINYKTPTTKLSALKDKPVIIDFFATWCSSCIAALPHLDSLQSRYKDSLQIFIVTYEPQKKLENFLSTNKVAKNIRLTFIAEDTILKELFPHKLIPHEVVINDRQVKAITYPEYLTVETLNTLISTNFLNVPIKQDLLQYDGDKTLEENANIKDKIIYHSLLTHYLEGFGFKTGTYKKNNSKRLVFTNAPLIFLYQIATEMRGQGINNRVILEVKNKDNYIIPEHLAQNSKWHDRAKINNYCYEITVPAKTPDSVMKKMMLQDLNRSLGIYGRVETRKIKCLKLAFESQKDTILIKSKGGRPKIKIDKNNKIKLIQNYPITALLTAVNNQAIPYPLHPIVIDKTNYKGKIDVKLNIRDIQNLSSLSKALSKYGLKLIPTEVNLQVLVISENNTHQNI